VQAAPPLAAEAAGGAQQTEPAPAAAARTKTEKEKQRKERQRQRKVEEAWEALQGAIEAMEETAGGVVAVEEAMQAAEKHAARSEKLPALVAEAKTLIEQARAAKTARARVVAEEAKEAAAVDAEVKAEVAVEQLRVEEEMAAIKLRVQSDTLRLRQMQAQVGGSVEPPAAPDPDTEETQCVVCMDAPKTRVVLPCMHMCVCEACAQLLRDRCPVCRGPIERIAALFA
jgi:hypothetical protein